MKRLIVGLAVLAVAAAMIVSPPKSTLASWADTEVSTGSFAAYTVPKPTINSCSVVNIVGSTILQIKWKYNSTTPAPTSTFWFGTASILTINLLAGSTTTTGPVSGEYTTTFSTGLLTGLLGGTAYVGVAAHQYGWQSPIATATANVPAVLGVGTCVITP